MLMRLAVKCLLQLGTDFKIDLFDRPMLSPTLGEARVSITYLLTKYHRNTLIAV